MKKDKGKKGERKEREKRKGRERERETWAGWYRCWKRLEEMSVGKRHLHVNGSMVTKVWLSGTRRGEVNEARSSGGKKRTAARWKKTRHGERNGGDIVSFRFRLLSVVNIHRTFSISCRASNHDFLKQFLLRSTRKSNLCKTSNDYDSFSIVIYLLLDVDLASDSYRINKCRIKFFHFQIK